MDKSVITRVVTVAGGRFAPGHLGELTQQVPFEMVDAVLEQTCRVQRRVRDLPARVVVYLLLAGCLFAELGYSRVWRRLTAGWRAAGRGPDRVRADPGAAGVSAPGRCARCSTCCAARPRRARGGGGCWSARSTAPSCPSPTARRTWPSTQSSAAAATAAPATRAAAAGPGQLRHPDRDRRRVPAVSCGETTCAPAAAGQPARRDAAARRPELRRRLPGREDRGRPRRTS